MSALRAFALLLVVFAVPRGAAAQDACTRESLSIEGTTVAASFCVRSIKPSAKTVEVVVDESFAAPAGSFTRTATLSFVTGTDASRTIDDAPLDRIGSRKTLHMTLVYRGGRVALDRALLLPGAIPVK